MRTAPVGWTRSPFQRTFKHATNNVGTLGRDGGGAAGAVGAGVTRLVVGQRQRDGTLTEYAPDRLAAAERLNREIMEFKGYDRTLTFGDVETVFKRFMAVTGENPDTGEGWQYMGTVDGRWHQFRNRAHPERGGQRAYAAVPV